MRKINGKGIVLALLVLGLFVTTFIALGPITGQTNEPQSTQTRIMFQLPTVVPEKDENTMAWDCPGCPGG